MISGIMRLSISQECEDAINEIRILHGNISFAEAIRRAIATELYTRRMMAKGWRHVMERDGNYRLLTWKHDDGRDID